MIAHVACRRIFVRSWLSLSQCSHRKVSGYGRLVPLPARAVSRHGRDTHDIRALNLNVDTAFGLVSSLPAAVRDRARAPSGTRHQRPEAVSDMLTKEPEWGSRLIDSERGIEGLKNTEQRRAPALSRRHVGEMRVDARVLAEHP